MIGAIIGAAASVAGGIMGGAAAARAKRRAMRYLDNKEKRATAEYNRDAFAVDDAVTSNARRKAREYVDDYLSRTEGQQAVAGGTEESVAAAKAQANKVMSDVEANNAEIMERKNEAAKQTYQQRMDAIDDARFQVKQGDAGAAAQAGSAISGVGTALVQADMNGELAGKGGKVAQPSTAVPSATEPVHGNEVRMRPNMTYSPGEGEEYKMGGIGNMFGV